MLRFFFIIFSFGILTACITQKTQSTVKYSNSKKTSNMVKKNSIHITDSSSNHSTKKGDKKLNAKKIIGKPYKIKGEWYYPKFDPTYKSTGKASWYGSHFHGSLTANGEIYDMDSLTAAHPTMPLPSYARVTNLKNGSSIIVRVNDRGPYIKGRIIDLSRRAAKMLGYANEGVADVRVEYIGEAPLDRYDSSYLLNSYSSGKLILSSKNTPKKSNRKDENIFSVSGMKSLQKSTKSLIIKGNLIKDSSIKLPKIGPVSARKPVSFILNLSDSN